MSAVVEYTLAWAACKTCGETWSSDLSPNPDFVVADVADECRQHLAATDHFWTFDVGIER